MSQVSALSQDQLDFLEPYLQLDAATARDDRPFVTLTYACSLDGMVSLSPGVRTTLSGSETKSMTHYLRLRHDAILVGAGTALADDPSLNCRYPGITADTQPQPFIVDPNTRWSPEKAAIVKLARSGAGKTPCVIQRTGNAPDLSSDNVVRLEISAAGGGSLDWKAILAGVKQRGFNSIMIEGGAMILNTLLARPDLVDLVIITIAPTWLGQGGVHVSPDPRHSNGTRINAATLQDTAWKQFGDDAVLCGRLKT